MTPTYLPGMEGEERDLSRSQWFTDPKLATNVWQWANQRERPSTVLEPSAGQGALIRPIRARPYDCSRLIAMDIDTRMVLALQSWMDARPKHETIKWQAVRADFLQQPMSAAQFDLVLMNPPYEDGQAELHVLHALGFAPRVVGIFKTAILHGLQRYLTLWTRARVNRIVFLATRPSFGRGASGSKAGETDFVVLEIGRENEHSRSPHLAEMEFWP